MAKKGVEFTHECLVFEVCQPQQAKEVLERNMSISTMLPAESPSMRRKVKLFWLR